MQTDLSGWFGLSGILILIVLSGCSDMNSVCVTTGDWVIGADGKLETSPIQIKKGECPENFTEPECETFTYFNKDLCGAWKICSDTNCTYLDTNQVESFCDNLSRNFEECFKGGERFSTYCLNGTTHYSEKICGGNSHA